MPYRIGSHISSMAERYFRPTKAYVRSFESSSTLNVAHKITITWKSYADVVCY